ncbi:MAG: non-canonical purine NTP pyrophosphatase [Myxococcota bacterium]
MTSDVRDALAAALRRWRNREILIATHNAGKLKEWKWLLERCNNSVVGASELFLPKPAETATSYRGNAKIKVRSAARHLGNRQATLVLADDTGLAIDAIGGAPGIHTARFAVKHGGFAGAALELNRRLQVAATKSTSCVYHCALSLGILSDTGWTYVDIDAQLSGTFASYGRGDSGFGFDPWFIRVGEQETFGEMTAERRDANNHRAQAARALAHRLSTQAARRDLSECFHPDGS